MRFRITKIVKGKWTDASLSDCMPDVFFTPGHVELVTVDEFPVGALPSAECQQFGHDTARGVLAMTLRTASRLIRPLEVGGEIDIDVEMCRLRNKVHRKCGTFKMYLSQRYYQ